MRRLIIRVLRNLAYRLEQTLPERLEVICARCQHNILDCRDCHRRLGANFLFFWCCLCGKSTSRKTTTGQETA